MDQENKTKMKVVILAAGMGTRMLPLTNEIPKVLVKTNEKEFLYYVIKSLQKAGYENFCLIVGYKKEKIEEFLKRENIKAKIIEQEKRKLCSSNFYRNIFENVDFKLAFSNSSSIKKLIVRTKLYLGVSIVAMNTN